MRQNADVTQESGAAVAWPGARPQGDQSWGRRRETAATSQLPELESLSALAELELELEGTCASLP
eukprot:4155472-Pyramimonas_sp.AAC.1